MFLNGTPDPREANLLVTAHCMPQCWYDKELEHSSCVTPVPMISLRLFTAQKGIHPHKNFGKDCIPSINHRLIGIMNHQIFQLNGYHQERNY